MKKSLVVFEIFFLFVMMTGFVVAECIDSDNGDVYTKGFAVENGITHKDFCKNSKQLAEADCFLSEGESTYVEANIDCLSECLDGACTYDKNFCSSNNYLCGVYQDNDGNEINCGTCSAGACIVGKCYPSEKVGKCALPSFGSGTISLFSGRKITTLAGTSPPCDFWSYKKGEEIIGDNSNFCKDYGCTWDDLTNTCSGDSKNCSDLSLDECTSRISFLLDCVIDNFPIKKQLYWTGINFLKSKQLKDLQKGETIQFTITFVNSELSSGAELNFEIYYFDYEKYSQFLISHPDGKSDSEWFENSEPVLLRTISGQIEDNKETTVQWDLSVDDLNKINYDGDASFFVEVSLEDGTKIISGEDYEPLIGAFVIIGNEPVSMLNLPPRLTRNRFGSITSVEYPIFTAFNLATLTEYCDGNLPCNTFTSESQCNFASREAEGLSDMGIISTTNSCVWNEATFSCEGEQGISCMILNQDECNQINSCRWKKYGLWQRFLDWLGSLSS